jgi:hypothetical protein
MKRLAIAVTFTVASAIAATCCRAQEKGIDLTLGNAPNALAGQNVSSGDTGKVGKKNKKAQAPSSGAHAPASSRGTSASPDQLDCGKLPVHEFVVDPSGSVSDTCQNLVGPACVEVFYNPIQNAVFLSSLAVVAGPDINKALFGAGAQGGEIPQQIPVNKNISETFHDLYQQEQELRQILDGQLRFSSRHDRLGWVPTVENGDRIGRSGENRILADRAITLQILNAGNFTSGGAQ